jgi:NAD(P)-dependent dehydrogenase (short-subunit alcohol dehydrogenase family)/quinol monooxygenase YgiN
MKLESKVFVVLGGGGGIGRAGCLALAEAGATVVVADIDFTAATSTTEAIASFGGLSTAVECDVSDTDSLERVRAIAGDAYGRIDGVWIHAGKALAGRLEDIPVPEWERLLDVNCLGAVRAVAVFAPDLLARGSGRIVLTSSSLAFFPEQLPEAAPYVLTKSGLLGYARALRAYLEPRGVAVTVVVPDATLTDHATKIPLIGLDEDAFRAGLDPSTMDSPEEVANALVKGLRNDDHLVTLTPDLRQRVTEADDVFLGEREARTVVVEGELRVEEAQHQSLAEALRIVSGPTAAESGNLAYRWTTDLERRGVFFLFEEWDTPDALARHAASAHGRAFLVTLGGLGPSTSDFRVRESSVPRPLELPD